MTIGIAVAFHDAIVLVADGRQADAEKVHSDQAQKVVKVREDLGLITAGIVMATNRALAWILNPPGLPAEAPAIERELGNMVFAAGSSVLQMVRPEDRHLPQLKAALIAAGFDAQSAFVVGALFGSGMPKASTNLARSDPTDIKSIVFGGEDTGARARFDAIVRVHLAQFRGGLINSAVMIPVLLETAADAIRHAAGRDQSIGGRMQYLILRRGFPAETGFIDS